MQVRCGFCKGFLRLYAQEFKKLAYDTMEQISHTESSGLCASKQNRGGRIASPELRHSLNLCEDFAGLEEETKPYDLLNLVKRAGKSLGFRKNMIELLDYYFRFTRECDWEQGARPIVFQSLSKTAMDLDVSERHVRRLEQELFKIGALSWHDSGNHKRYGHRDPQSGRIIYAFGVDLTPLAYLKAELENALHEQELYKQAWSETKRQISWYRSQIRGVIAEIEGQGRDASQIQRRYDDIAVRLSASMSLESLRAIHAEHKTAYEELITLVTTRNNKEIQEKESAKADSNVLHYKYSKKPKSNKLDTNSSPTDNSFQESRSRSSEGKTDRTGHADRAEPEKRDQTAGLEHITLKQMLNAASMRFREHLPLSNRAMNLNDFVEAAHKTRGELGISQKSWGQACQELGRAGAAICVLLVDQATLRPENPVRKPAAYFNSMIKLAGVGELHLQKSIMGLLKREIDVDAANLNAQILQQERN